MALYRLHAVASRIPPVAVHLKGHMLGYGALLQGTDEELPELLDGPFSRGGFEDEPPDYRNNVAHVARWAVAVNARYIRLRGCGGRNMWLGELKGRIRY